MAEYFVFALICAIILLLVTINFSIRRGNKELTLFESLCDSFSLFASIWAWYWVGIGSGLTGKMSIFCVEMPVSFLILAAKMVAFSISLRKAEETCKKNN